MEIPSLMFPRISVLIPRRFLPVKGKSHSYETKGVFLNERFVFTYDPFLKSNSWKILI